MAAVSPESGVLAVTAADGSEHSTRDWATIRGVLMAAVGCVVWLLVTTLDGTGWAAVCFPSCGSSPVDVAFVWAVVCLLTVAGCDVLMVTAVEGAWRTAVCFPLCGLTPAGCAAVGWAAVCLCAVWLTMSVSGAGRRRWQSAVSVFVFFLAEHSPCNLRASASSLFRRNRGDSRSVEIKGGP